MNLSHTHEAQFPNQQVMSPETLRCAISSPNHSKLNIIGILKCISWFPIAPGLSKPLKSQTFQRAPSKAESRRNPRADGDASMTNLSFTEIDTEIPSATSILHLRCDKAYLTSLPHF